MLLGSPESGRVYGMQNAGRPQGYLRRARERDREREGARESEGRERASWNPPLLYFVECMHQVEANAGRR